MKKDNISVCYVYRSKNVSYSIERVFERIRLAMNRAVVQSEVYCPSNKYRNPFSYIKNALATRKCKADIYHITGVVHYIALFFSRNKTIITVHYLGHIFNTKGIVGFFLRLIFAYLPLRWSKNIVAISQFSKDEIVEKVGIPAEKISVIYDPAPEEFKYTPRKIDLEKPRILSFCHLPNKNLARIIESLSGINCHLRIIGKLSEEYLNLLEKYKIEYSNCFNIPSQQILDEYKQCDFLLFPSTYEGFGVPILEAQLTGRPVITSNIAPMTEVAGESAILVNPFDVTSIKEGIQKLLASEDFAYNLIELGLENAKRFDCNIISNQYLDLYKKILNKH